VNMLRAAGLILKDNQDFHPERKASVHPGPLGPAGAAARAVNLPEGNPDRIVCRCEQVTEGIIRDALSRNLSIGSMDGVKRRTRAGMGACQGAFCGPGVRTMVAESAGITEDEVFGPSRDRVKILENLAAMRALLK